MHWKTNCSALDPSFFLLWIFVFLVLCQEHRSMAIPVRDNLKCKRKWWCLDSLGLVEYLCDAQSVLGMYKFVRLLECAQVLTNSPCISSLWIRSEKQTHSYRTQGIIKPLVVLGTWGVWWEKEII